MLPTTKPIDMPKPRRTKKPLPRIPIAPLDSAPQPASCESECSDADRRTWVCYTDPSGVRWSLPAGACLNRCWGRKNLKAGRCPEHGEAPRRWIRVREGDKEYDVPRPFAKSSLRETLNAHATYGRRGSEADFPFQDRGGYGAATVGDVNEWRVRREGEEYPWWKPYGLPGAVYEDGGLLPAKPGDLPVVRPPKDRYGIPYFMEPLWLQGSAATQDYYAANCPVRVRGRLHYVGPSNLCANASFGSDTTVAGEKEECGADFGAWRWGWLERYPDGEYNDSARLGPFMRTKVRAHGLDKLDRVMLDEHDRRERQLAEFYLKYGYELPPWMRRGPYELPDLIRKHCPRGGKNRKPPVPPRGDTPAGRKLFGRERPWGLGR